MEDRRKYFDNLVRTSEKYFVPYLSGYTGTGADTKILEIGCGEGGNLLPFARMGCDVTGVDLSESKIEHAIRFFREERSNGTFLACDIFKADLPECSFDMIICHDVIEHIADKAGFLSGIQRLLKPEGIAFIAFPAWQMPFGGHQQMCRNKRLSRLPFFHLLPAPWYRRILTKAGESPEAIKEFMEIKRTGTTVELFEKLIRETGLIRLDRHLYFINPHYEAKFGLKPRTLNPVISAIPWLRNFFSTSCFYILKKMQ